MGKWVNRKFRLTRSTDFQRVKREGKSIAHPLIVLIVAPNQQPYSRFAIAAGRSLGNAVRRNRAKRRLRACMDAIFTTIKPGWDVVIYGRQRMDVARFSEIQQAVASVLSEAELALAENENDVR